MVRVKKLIAFALIFYAISSCSSENIDSDVDSFYTAKVYQDYPVLPLAKPVFLYYDKSYTEWFLNIPESFNANLDLGDLDEIGVDSSYVFGKITGKKRSIEEYSPDDFVYMYSNGTVTWGKRKREITDDMILINSMNTIDKSFIEPDRWFIIDIPNGKTEMYFLKDQYEKFLEDRRASNTMYNLTKYHKRYSKTGVLPWFPDSIKAKLNKVEV